MRSSLLVVAVAALASPAHGQEVFGGVLAHDIDSPFTFGGQEDGADFQLGWRGGRIRALSAIGSPSPYVFGSVHTGGDTHFIAAGVSWKIGGRLFLRPGLGFAVHTRRSDGVDAEGFRTDLGSRVLFEPEVGVGYQISDRVAIEATWVHISNGQVFSRQNPGMDSVGIRLSYRLR
jgi:lipid A 3-O-deacylase